MPLRGRGDPSLEEYPPHCNGAKRGVNQMQPAMNDENKIYVGGLSLDTTSDSLRAHFWHFGEVTDCVVMPDRVTGKSRGFGFVTFRDSSAANAALGTSCIVDGREVSCKKAVRESPQSNALAPNGLFKSNKIFVGGLPATCDHEKFTAYFGRFGEIEDAVVMMDNQTQRHRGFGYVTFVDPACVEGTLQNYAANAIDGKWIEVKRCIPQDRMVPGQSFKGKGSGKGFGKSAKGKGFAPGGAPAMDAGQMGGMGTMVASGMNVFASFDDPAYGAHALGAGMGANFPSAAGADSAAALGAVLAAAGLGGSPGAALAGAGFSNELAAALAGALAAEQPTRQTSLKR